VTAGRGLVFDISVIIPVLKMFPGVEYALLPATPAKQDLRRCSTVEGSSKGRARDGRQTHSSEGRRGPQLQSVPLGQHVVRLEKRDIKEWPKELLNRTGLKTLVLSRNLLRTVVSGVVQLKNLRRLELSFNRITSISPEIGKMAHLETILLDHNHLETVPIELGLLVQLKVINLDGNPLSGRACSTAVETLREVWHTGPEQTEGKGMADRTRRVLHYLQDHMNSEQHSELGDRLRRWRKREARHALGDALGVADMGRLQKAVNSAEAAGLGLEDTATARQALSILHALSTATGNEDVQGIMTAIASWEKVTNSGEGSCRVPGKGSDLDRALQVLHDVKRKTLAMSWRKRSHRLGKLAHAEEAAGYGSTRVKPMSSLTGVHVTPRVDTPYEKTRKPSKAVGGTAAAIPYVQWLQNKKSAEKQKDQDLKEFTRKQRLESISRRALEEEVRELLYQKEASWPSQLEAGAYPIALQDKDGEEGAARAQQDLENGGAAEPFEPNRTLARNALPGPTGDRGGPSKPQSFFAEVDLFRDTGHRLSTIEESGETLDVSRSLDLAVNFPGIRDLRNESNAKEADMASTAAMVIEEQRPQSLSLSDIESPHMSESSTPCVSPRVPAMATSGLLESPVASPRAVRAT